MPQSKRLKNYIRSARKRAGLTQDELAYLLGMRGGKAMSRYELFEREPMLPTALILEAAAGETIPLVRGSHCSDLAGLRLDRAGCQI